MVLPWILQNPWDVIPFSGNARIHLDSFLSVFNISGLPEEYYHNRMAYRIILETWFILSSVTHEVWHTKLLLAGRLSNDGDSFVDGAVIAAARTLPTWSDGDIPPIPSAERKAVKELQDECQQMLAEFPTTSVQDQEILGNLSVRTPCTISW